MEQAERRTVKGTVLGGRFPGLLAPPLRPEDISLQTEIRDGKLLLRLDSTVDWEFWIEAELSPSETNILLHKCGD